MTCSHVFEVVMGKDYAYCDRPGTVMVQGNPFCDEHGRVMVETITND